MTTIAPASLSLLPAAGRKHSQRDACLHIPSGSVHVAQNLRVQGAGIDTVLADGTSSARVKYTWLSFGGDHRCWRHPRVTGARAGTCQEGPRSAGQSLLQEKCKLPLFALNLTESTKQPS